MKIILLGVLLWGLVGCVAVSEQPEFVAAVAKEGDGVETAVTPSSVTFDITSQTGIGSAEISLANGEWPETILIRLHLAGLESFEFAYSDVVVTASVSSGEGHRVMETAVQGETTHSVAEDSPFYMPVRIETESGEASIPLKDGYFEIEAPADFLAGGYESFTIRWIDFYR